MENTIQEKLVLLEKLKKEEKTEEIVQSQPESVELSPLISND